MVTGRTACQLLDRWNVVFLDQATTKRDLVLVRRPVKVEYGLFRAQIFFWLAMAAQTPLHLERAALLGQRHLIDLTMTGRTANTFIDMNAVVEINKIAQVMHAIPLDGRVVGKAIAHRGEHRAIVPDLRMAGHAGVGWRSTRRCRCFNRSMAVTTIDAEGGDMVLMTERNRLLDGCADGGVPGRANEVKAKRADSG